MAAQFVGSLISLISKSDIRYQGVLHSIDPQAATVSLEKVRSLGTEGRKGNPAEEVPASDNVYDFIVFRASDVKDLQIEAPAAAAESSAPSDPAIVGTAAPATLAAQPAPTPQPAAASPPKPAEPSQPAQQQQQQQAPSFSAPGPSSPFPPPPPHLGGAGSPFGAYPPPFPPSPFGAPGLFGPYGAPYPPPFGGPGGPGPFGPAGPFGAPPFPGGPGGPGQLPPPHLGGQQQPPQGLTSPAVSAAAAPSPAVQKQQSPVVPPVGGSAGVHPILDNAAGSALYGEKLKSPETSPVAPVTPQETRPETNGTAAIPAAPSSPAKQAAPAPAPTGIKGPADIEQLAKDMSRANLGQRPPQQQQRREDGVGASIFSGPASNNAQQRPRQLQSYGNQQQQPKQAVPVPDAEFDFEKANAAFSRPQHLPAAPAQADEAAAPASAAASPNGASGEDDFVIPPAEEFYNPKSSFFDSISSDSKTRTDPAQATAMGRYGGMGGGGFGGGRYDRQKERERNLEAFGTTGQELGNGGRGFRRGPGGGSGGNRQGGGAGGRRNQGYGGGQDGQRQGGGGGYGRQNYGQRQQQQQ
ncbi:hypothetical protein JCM8547_005672 [Rhodosporidiobolus lusitaniae]